MTRRTRALLGGTAVALTVSLVGCASGGEPSGQVIRLGVVPAETSEATLSSWAIFTELFEQETGMEIEMFEATNLAPVVEAAIAGDLDLMMLGPFAQVLARDNGAQIETVGALIDNPESEESSSMALVRADSDVAELKDLAGEDVCFIDPGSASGYLFPAGGFLDEGIDPETDLNPIFVGDHVSAIDAMLDGECAGVFTFGGNEAFAREPDVFSKIWEAEVPNPGFSISTALDADVSETVVDAILKINGDLAEEQNLCTDDTRVPGDDGPVCHAVDVFWGSIPKDDTYWEPLREVCEATQAPACKE